jgi:sterol desaturase/sphingolipid hydroxylase (fatty acid hydroxylase superfamily)
MIPFDQWFGTYHDGSEEMHNKMQLRLRVLKKKII